MTLSWADQIRASEHPTIALDLVVEAYRVLRRHEYALNSGALDYCMACGCTTKRGHRDDCRVGAWLLAAETEFPSIKG